MLAKRKAKRKERKKPLGAAAEENARAVPPARLGPKKCRKKKVF